MNETNDNIFKRISKRFNELPTNINIIYACILYYLSLL